MQVLYPRRGQVHRNRKKSIRGFKERTMNSKDFCASSAKQSTDLSLENPRLPRN